jgi:hypothetical protein
MAKYQYDFVKVTRNISEQNVKSIISEAGYDPRNYTYSERVDKDGWLVEGDVVMSITLLEGAARRLKIPVAIYSPNAESLMLAASADAATTYDVQINMDDNTVNKLGSGGYRLYGFKAVRTETQGGAPVVWFQTDTFSTDTNVSWVTYYQAYVSLNPDIQNGVVIKASNSVDVTLGDIFNVRTAKGTGDVTQDGPRGTISVNNLTEIEFACGISQKSSLNQKPQPICAFPLYGNGLDVMAPIEKVLLMFSTKPVNTGTVIEQSYSSSIMIDLTGAPDNQREVSFDINKGWSWGGYNWAQKYPANSNLIPLLIDSSATVQTRRLIQ